MRVLERVADAWRSTPTKWYPLPWFVGACLLVFLQYRRNSKAAKEVEVGEDGEHVVKLRGPWQVSCLLYSVGIEDIVLCAGHAPPYASSEVFRSKTKYVYTSKEARTQQLSFLHLYALHRTSCQCRHLPSCESMSARDQSSTSGYGYCNA